MPSLVTIKQVHEDTDHGPDADHSSTEQSQDSLNHLA